MTNMKIENSPNRVSGRPLDIAGGAPKTNKGVTSPPSTGTSGSASVQLSPLSSILQTIGSNMADTPVVDAARVSEIRLAIAEGRFKVNPDVVADHLLQTARDLWRARQ